MKRGESGLNLVIGVAKPVGMTSHDVVSRVRHILGEKRVGHTGTLDPLASGVLPVCVGSAARLNPYLTAEDKRYEVAVAFGAATDTDDAQGQVIRTGAVSARLYDEGFARQFVAGLVGRSRQLPPVYSAIKVNGKKACDEARKGNVISIEPRDIEVYGAQLLGIDDDGGEGGLRWHVAFHVSKGTYIRALVRDMGNALGCPAHVAALERTASGALELADCLSLEALEQQGARAAIDPVALLGLRFAFLGGAAEKAVSNGAPLPVGALELCERNRRGVEAELCACTSGVVDSPAAPAPGELVALVAQNKLMALYEHDEAAARFKPRCVFQGGIIRGSGI